MAIIQRCRNEMQIKKIAGNQNQSYRSVIKTLLPKEQT